MRVFESLLFWFLWSLFVLLVVCRFCSAQKINQEDRVLALRLVQCIRAECNDCERYPREKDAIAWVLVKRTIMRGEDASFLGMIKSYCSVFKVNTPRARAIRKSTFHKPLHGSPRWWRKMERWAYRFIGNPLQVLDPTPMAFHWGSKEDSWRAYCSGMRLVRKYSNYFWTLPRWRCGSKKL